MHQSIAIFVYLNYKHYLILMYLIIFNAALIINLILYLCTYHSKFGIYNSTNYVYIIMRGFSGGLKWVYASLPPLPNLAKL